MRLDVSLESFEAERRDFQRVIDAIGAIKRASHETLLDLEWLHETICSVGLGQLHPDEIFGIGVRIREGVR
jgi:hypothetical protein